MHVLAATDSVHTTAAICDYLSERCGSDDRVTVVAVGEPAGGVTERDCQEALNVASVRLLEPTVTTEYRASEEPAETIRTLATEHAVDELIIGPHAGEPDHKDQLGTTATTLLEVAERPVVVVPFPPLS